MAGAQEGVWYWKCHVELLVNLGGCSSETREGCLRVRLGQGSFRGLVSVDRTSRWPAVRCRGGEVEKRTELVWETHVRYLRAGYECALL